MRSRSPRTRTGCAWSGAIAARGVRAVVGGAILVVAMTAGCGGGGGGDDGGDGEGTGTLTSICGGPVTSAPRLCSLTVSPSNVSRFGSITLRYGVSDLEGDIDLICVGFTAVGGTPVIDCSAGAPRGRLINEFLTTSPIAIGGLPAGTYIIGFNVGDQGGHTSNTVTAQFRVL